MVNLEIDMLFLIFGCKVPLNITNAASGFKVLEKNFWITATNEHPEPESNFLPRYLSCIFFLLFSSISFYYSCVYSFIYNTMMCFFARLSPSPIIKAVCSLEL